jgi:hypothetical protein
MHAFNYLLKQSVDLDSEEVRAVLALALADAQQAHQEELRATLEVGRNLTKYSMF